MHHEASNGDNSIGGGGDGFGAVVPALPVAGSDDYLDTRGDTVGGNIAGNIDTVCGALQILKVLRCFGWCEDICYRLQVMY